jgi:hypothetical protein
LDGAVSLFTHLVIALSRWWFVLKVWNEFVVPGWGAPVMDPWMGLMVAWILPLASVSVLSWKGR